MEIIQDLNGKTIKYCNIVNGGDGNERNVIATTNNEIMMFDVDYENGTIKCYSQKQVEMAISVYKATRIELLSNNIVTQEEVDIITKAREEMIAKRDEQMKQERYKQYLKLKSEFEP